MIFGTYLHGLFDSPGFRRAFLRGLNSGSAAMGDVKETWLKSIERGAEVVERSINVDEMEGWLS